MNSVFAITTVGFQRDKGLERIDSMRQRTVGVFKTLEEAQRTLDKNYGDLNEAGWYPWAVIEEIEFGLYPELGERKQIFYEYDHKLETAIKPIGWKQLEEIPDTIYNFMKSHSLIVWFAEIG